MILALFYFLICKLSKVSGFFVIRIFCFISGYSISTFLTVCSINMTYTVFLSKFALLFLVYPYNVIQPLFLRILKITELHRTFTLYHQIPSFSIRVAGFQSTSTPFLDVFI